LISKNEKKNKEKQRKREENRRIQKVSSSLKKTSSRSILEENRNERKAVKKTRVFSQ
jgi:hypothetical protein